MSKKFVLDFSTPRSILSFDIGEKYTGVALVHNLSTKGGLASANIVLEQINHKSTNTRLDCDRIVELIRMNIWDLIILEDYKLYPNRTDEDGGMESMTHFKTYSPLFEVRHLGVATFTANELGIPTVLQMASVVKNLSKPKVAMGGHTTGTHVKDAINHTKKYFLTLKHKGRTVKF